MEPQTQPAREPRRRLPGPLRAIVSLGADPSDDEVQRILKGVFAVGHALIAIPFSFAYAAAIWIAGEPVAALVVLAFGVGAFGALVALRAWPDKVERAAWTSAASMLLLALFRPLAMGAYPNYASGTLFGLLGVVTVLAIAPYSGRVAFALYAVLGAIVVAVVTVTPILNPDSNLPPLLFQAITVVDILTTTSIVTVVVAFSLSERLKLQRLADGLLDAILPGQVARTLKQGPRVIAERFESVSILFADVVGFTPLSATLAPEDLVGMLDEVFSDFDAVVDRAGLEKIKTVGDTYMVAAGVPEPREDHAPALVRAALELRDITASRTYRGHRLVFRFGINSGPVVAGVIGRRKFAYDLWGDAVNVASRMESHGVGGEIHVTAATRSLLDDRFELEPIGPIELKGRGLVDAWRVVGVRPG